ncbi:hypothetical protein NIES4071_44220 [Calothrix sp. NIES-4071]|nr:hypothetical protein NIES4071_44220 [Calothrix sp. NIES-4071]BAZ58736.1 hypothetical protein NIES4105_44150 [Calothrix sp. NIES-4105]
MNSNGFIKLTNFLVQLEQHKINYTLAHHRDESIMVLTAVPGQRWEIEFFHDGSVEIERFTSAGEIEGEAVLSELFPAYIEPDTELTVPQEKVA